MRSMLDFYARMLPFAQARSAAQFRHATVGGALSDGAVLFEETTTQFGTYEEGNWGCNASTDRSTVTTRPEGASQNRFIRFHFTGSLEMSLMALDLYDTTQDPTDVEAYLPLIAAVVKGYLQRFPNRDARTGKIDMWPSQALETYGCHNFSGAEGGGLPSRTTCMTNPSTDIAGLMAVLPRLLALPHVLTTAADREAWDTHLQGLPPLPTAAAGQCFLPASNPACHWNGTAVHARKFAPVAAPELGSEALAAQRQNSENTELYVYGNLDIFLCDHFPALCHPTRAA